MLKPGIRPTDASDASLMRLHNWTIATASTTGVEWTDFRGSLWNRDGRWVQGSPTPEWAAYPGIRVAVKTS